MQLSTAWKPVWGRLAVRVSREQSLRLLALGLIIVLAAVLRFANLEALGYVNHYYSAAVTSMLQSWHNFFFVAAEPGGSVSVDKPPVGLWLQAISAYLLGVNTLGVLLPELLAGILSVVVVYHLVGRKFGAGAGLLAALALAITPVVVATDRNNTMDSTLILTLLLAAWAFIKATETRRLRYLLLGAVLVGIGFNIKMLEAYLPLPAFYALYFLGAAERLPRKIGKLALTSVLLLVVSLSWAVAVDLTPADQRPYVGSSTDNSELSLIIGYNGLNRLLGRGGGLGVGTAPAGGMAPQGPGGAPQPGQGNVPRPPAGQDGTRVQPPAGSPPRPGQAGDGVVPPGGARPGGAPARGGAAAGRSDLGQAGALRLFTAPLSKEASWLLPFGLIGAATLALRTRVRRPLVPEHQALTLWGGWLLTAGVFFSVAGFFHEYYLSILAPAAAALVGIGAVTLWRLRAERPWLALGLLLAAAAATLALQVTTASAYVSDLWWLALVAALLGAGMAVSAVTARRPPGALARAGFACVMAALLVTPGIWSALTTSHSSPNLSLPSAYSGRDVSTGPGAAAGLMVNTELLNYLQANTQGVRYLMAVPSSMQGADYVLATGRPVLYLGGFNGQDPVETPESLAQLVAGGELRYVYSSAGGGGTSSRISNWVRGQCTAVSGFDTQTRNAGAPDGTIPGQNDGQTGQARGSGGGDMRVTLYDCQE